MKVERSFDVALAPDDVWDLLLDFEQTLECLPGVERFVRVGEDRFEGALLVGVGPVTARFRGVAEILQAVRPRHLLAKATVHDHVTRSDVEVHVDCTLAPRGDGATQVQYVMEITFISVPLAQLMFPIIRMGAERLNDDFVRCLRSKLQEAKGLPVEGGPRPALWRSPGR